MSRTPRAQQNPRAQAPNAARQMEEPMGLKTPAEYIASLNDGPDSDSLRIYHAVARIDARKCVIVDLDGVLWPGVLAETEPSGPTVIEAEPGGMVIGGCTT